MIGTPQDPRELAVKLGVDLDKAPAKPKAKPKAKGNKAETNGQAQTEGQAQTNGREQTGSDDLSAYPGVRKALETRTVRLDGTADRSSDAHRVARACFNAGLTLTPARRSCARGTNWPTGWTRTAPTRWRGHTPNSRKMTSHRGRGQAEDRRWRDVHPQRTREDPCGVGTRRRGAVA